MINNNDIIDVFEKNNLNLGRMISFSKSLYLKSYPKNNVIFNANIFTLEDGKVWYGDLDITIDKNNLEKISEELNKKLYIIREHDGRFENENIDSNKIKEVSVEIIG